MKRSVTYREVGGRALAPPSKSSMQRAVACALLAEGESILRSPSRSADCMAALGAASALGAAVRDSGDSFSVVGLPEGALREARERSLSCGESGLCMRMFSPIAALFAGRTRLEAEGSLRRRPVGMVAAPLERLGAECRTGEGGLPPVVVVGPLRGGRAKVDGRASSQLLTGLLVALPVAGLDSELEVEALASRGYVDLSLDTMAAFGIEVERDPGFGFFKIRGGRRYAPADFTVEGDWSGAAFLLVAAALAAAGEGLAIDGLDTRSSQPDRAVLEALRACGAGVEAEGGSIRVRRIELRAFSFDATDCPDLFPPLVALAAGCEGDTCLRGAGRLRAKESDRAAALSEEFGALGAELIVEGDLMTVRGRGALAGGRVDSRGDHRIAMAAAIASLYCRSPVEIGGAECVSKSWPTFFEDMATIAR
jgi:3-phosphoshikimate 1-carboxyvinyltransferase